MGARSSGREAALQILFAIDAAGHSAERAIEDFWREFPADAEGRTYADFLAKNIVLHRADLDAKIGQVSTNWRLERMTRVDRNILRLGAYELLHQSDVPRAVIIDEGIELAKRYGAEGSASFINGLLDSFASRWRSGT